MTREMNPFGKNDKIVTPEKAGVSIRRNALKAVLPFTGRDVITQWASALHGTWNPEDLPGAQYHTPETERDEINAEYVVASGRGTGLLRRAGPAMLGEMKLPSDHLDAFYRTPKQEHLNILLERYPIHGRMMDVSANLFAPPNPEGLYDMKSLGGSRARTKPTEAGGYFGAKLGPNGQPLLPSSPKNAIIMGQGVPPRTDIAVCLDSNISGKSGMGHYYTESIDGVGSMDISFSPETRDNMAISFAPVRKHNAMRAACAKTTSQSIEWTRHLIESIGVAEFNASAASFNITARFLSAELSPPKKKKKRK